jgi:cell wall-associated NlpC family hydrolase
MNTDQYLNIPFSECDCFALAARVYRDHGIDIGHYSEPDFSEKWEPVSDPKRLDLIYVDFPVQGEHVGVCIGHGKFIHALKKRTPVIASIGFWSRHIKGIYRWRK